jgi:hypothetical protein
VHQKKKNQREAGSIIVLSTAPIITAMLLMLVPSLEEPIKILLLGITLLAIALVGRRQAKRASFLNAATEADGSEDGRSDTVIGESLPVLQALRDSNSLNRTVSVPVLGNGHDMGVREKVQTPVD